MNKNQQIVVSAIVILLILAFAYIIFQDMNKRYEYEFVEENIKFASNYNPPGEYLISLKNENEFIISPTFYERGPATAIMTGSLVLFNSILIANGKDVVTLGRVVDPENNLLYCQTNEGDVLVNEKIELEECKNMLNTDEKAIIFIELPNENLDISEAILEKNRITIRPNSSDEVSRVSFVVLKTMYSDSEEIIAQINEILGKISV
ncbi:MAG: hypothetical protein ABID38_05660 [Candidatus Diapherotrites archaeon]